MIGETMQEQSATRSGWPGVALVWAIALAGCGVVLGLAYSGTDEWFGDSTPLGMYGALGVVLAVSVLGSLIVQLASRRPEGFVARTSWSIAGAVLVVAVTALAVAPVATG
jgi:hypothetical protein